jgi:very-short-patch-repair endonuclease
MNRSDIRKFYASVMPQIEAEQPYLWALTLFELDDIRACFTPIEAALWSDLREEGAVMYPQFPVAGYFLDFGNPVAKVAIECDGAHHLLQRDADDDRQRDIEARGWTVFRLTGTDCMRNGRPIWEDGTYEMAPAVRLIREIAAEFPISARSARRIPGYQLAKRDSWASVGDTA